MGSCVVDGDTVNMVVSIISAICMLVGGVFKILTLSWTNVIVGAYVFLFGIATILLAAKKFEFAGKWAPFMLHPLGKAFFFLFVGTLILGSTWQTVMGIVVIASGFILAILFFISCANSTPSPSPSKQPNADAV